MHKRAIQVHGHEEPLVWKLIPRQPLNVWTLVGEDLASNIQDDVSQTDSELDEYTIWREMVGAKDMFMGVTVTIGSIASDHLVPAIATPTSSQAGPTVEEIFVPHLTGWAGEDPEEIYFLDDCAAGCESPETVSVFQTDENLADKDSSFGDRLSVLTATFASLYISEDVPLTPSTSLVGDTIPQPQPDVIDAAALGLVSVYVGEDTISESITDTSAGNGYGMASGTEDGTVQDEGEESEEVEEVEEVEESEESEESEGSEEDEEDEGEGEEEEEDEDMMSTGEAMPEPLDNEHQAQQVQPDESGSSDMDIQIAQGTTTETPAPESTGPATEDITLPNVTAAVIVLTGSSINPQVVAQLVERFAGLSLGPMVSVVENEEMANGLGGQDTEGEANEMDAMVSTSVVQTDSVPSNGEALDTPVLTVEVAMEMPLAPQDPHLATPANPTLPTTPVAIAVVPPPSSRKRKTLAVSNIRESRFKFKQGKFIDLLIITRADVEYTDALSHPAKRRRTAAAEDLNSTRQSQANIAIVRASTPTQTVVTAPVQGANSDEEEGEAGRSRPTKSIEAARQAVLKERRLRGRKGTKGKKGEKEKKSGKGKKGGKDGMKSKGKKGKRNLVGPSAAALDEVATAPEAPGENAMADEVALTRAGADLTGVAGSPLVDALELSTHQRSSASGSSSEEVPLVNSVSPTTTSTRIEAEKGVKNHLEEPRLETETEVPAVNTNVDEEQEEPSTPRKVDSESIPY